MAGLGGRLAGHPAQLLDGWPDPRAPVQRTTLRSLRSGTMRSMPNSVSFCTTHSGRSPLTGAKATVRAGSALASNCTDPSPPDAGRGQDRLERGGTAPAGAGPVAAPVGGHDLFTVA